MAGLTDTFGSPWIPHKIRARKKFYLQLMDNTFKLFAKISKLHQPKVTIPSQTLCQGTDVGFFLVGCGGMW
jgi:hypothetical protein